MRGEERGIIGFPEKLFGFGAIGIGADRDRVDIGALIGAIIVHPPSTRPTIGCLQWSGLFGIGLKPVQLFGIGSGGTLEKVQPPEDSTSSSGVLRTNLYNCSFSSKLPGSPCSFQKKIKKMLFVVDQGRNDCYL